MQPGLLPKEYEDKNRVRHMEVGQEGYIVPWSIDVDTDYKMYISQNTPFFDTGGGTIHIKIRKEADGVSVYEYTIKSDDKWQLRVIQNMHNLLPVKLI